MGRIPSTSGPEVKPVMKRHALWCLSAVLVASCQGVPAAEAPAPAGDGLLAAGERMAGAPQFVLANDRETGVVAYKREAALASAPAGSARPYRVLVASPGPLSEEDQQFLMGTAIGNMAEVALGKIASTHGASPACRAFGQRMVADHTANLAQLKALAASLGVVLPKEPSSEFTSLAGQLAKIKGKTFDELYLDAMIEDHTSDVAEFKEQSDKAGSARVRAYAAKTLRVLETHLRMAKDARKGL